MWAASRAEKGKEIFSLKDARKKKKCCQKEHCPTYISAQLELHQTSNLQKYKVINLCCFKATEFVVIVASTAKY